MNEYRENLLYAQIGEKLIGEEEILEHIRENDIRIRYLESNKPAGKSKRVILGECRKFSDRNRQMLEACNIKKEDIPDFVIVIYKERIHGFTNEQLRILIMHELMHIGVKEDSETGVVSYHLVKHDLEDFRAIIEQYGTDWTADKSQLTWQQIKQQERDGVFDEVTGEILEG